MSFVTVAAVGGLALSAYGAYDSHQQAGAMQRAQNRALANATTSLNGFQSQGILGTGATYWNNPNGQGGQIQLNPGQFAPHLDRLTGFAQQALPSSPSGLPPDLAAALSAVTGRSGLPSDLGSINAGLASLGQRGSQVGDMAFNDLLAQRAFSNTAFRGADQQLRDAMMGGGAARAQQLDLLRQEAAPFESRAFEGLQQNLFNTGRLGTTGGALQTEAFARGLGQADVSRQLAAAQEGRAFQQNAFGLASGSASLGDQLLQNAFGRFGNIQNMNMDINSARFDRSMYANQVGFDRSRDILGLRSSLATLPGQLDAQRLGNSMTALQGQAGIQEQLLQLFNAGLGAEQAAANARIGSGSNMAAIVGSPNFGIGGQMQASTIGQLGTALMGGQSASDILGRIFGPTSSNHMALDWRGPSRTQGLA